MCETNFCVWNLIFCYFDFSPLFQFITSTAINLQFAIFKNLFLENSCFSSKTNTPFVTTTSLSAPNYCLYNLWRHQCDHQYLFAL